LYAKEKEEIEKCIAVKKKQNIFGNIYSCITLIFLTEDILNSSCGKLKIYFQRFGKKLRDNG